MTASVSGDDAEIDTPEHADPLDQGRTFLVGATIHLRGAEVGDAKWATAWRGSPFPISAEKAEEQLKKSVPEQGEKRRSRLIACRRSDGRPVGSAVIDDSDNTVSSMSFFTDPALGPGGGDLEAEMLGLLLPWLADERHRPIVVLGADVDTAPLLQRAEVLGMRPAVRLRDGVWRNGRHRDRIFYDYPNPAWVARLGDPGIGIDDAGEPVVAPRVPAPRRAPGEVFPLPDNALLGSARLALRPMQAEDAEPIVRSVLAEPDASFGHSRFPLSPIGLSHWFGKIGEDDPSSDMEVAVVLRETGEMIGEVGLYDIDWLARTAESGSWFYKPEHRGGGYGTEAKHLLLEYAFDWLGLNMIWSWVKSRNPRSQAALRKQGYRDAGRANWVGFGPDGFEDARMFDLLAEEWRAARDQG